MRTILISSIFLALFLLGTNVTLANNDDAVIAKMATILKGINHYPNSNEKSYLQSVSKDKSQSDANQAIAKSILNMQHSISAGDRNVLEKLKNDPKLDNRSRALIDVLLGFSHMASSSDKKILANIAGN